MAESQGANASPLQAVSNAMVKLHKEQFGRGPTGAQSHFAGPDALVCVLQNALLPAERKLVELGDKGRVRETRIAFQAARRPNSSKRSRRSSTARSARSGAPSIQTPTSSLRTSTSSDGSQTATATARTAERGS